VTNPDLVGETSSFLITTYYDELALDQTDTTPSIANPITTTLIDVAGTITTDNFDFVPRNEGEKATYTFQLTGSQRILNLYYIIVHFPSYYDESISPHVYCEILYGLTGNVECFVEDYKVILKGFDTQPTLDTIAF